MGIVFGKTGIDASKGLSPAFEVLLAGGSFQVRAYPSYFVAECSPLAASSSSSESEEKRDDRFGILANYIGVFKDPQNEGAEAIAMTAPVVMSGEKIAMTAPVVQSGGVSDRQTTMAFILPAKYRTFSQIPKPLNSRVTIREVPERVILTTTFNGLVRDMGVSKLQELAETSQKHPAIAPLVNADNLSANKWELSRYHPPFTLPMLQKNEIWITLPISKAKFVAQLKRMEEAAAAAAAEK